jgi:branched-chain amino acid aminotransferase
MSGLSVWHIKEDGNTAIHLKDESSLDAITRQLPDGYYSTFRTYAEGRRVLGLAAHMQRLYEPMSTPEVSEAMLRRQLSALLEAYRPNEARVRAIMTGQGEVYLAIAPLVPLPRDVYDRGVRVESTELQREQPRLKSTSFIGRSNSERNHIAQEGIFEALLVKEGKILEGMTSNFFYVLPARDNLRDNKQHASSALLVESASRGAILGTARDDILLGVTRETVIEIARGRGLELNYQPLPLDQVPAIDEAFLTSSSRGIVPVVRVDDVTIGQGSPGPVTQQLRGEYELYVLAKAEKI